MDDIKCPHCGHTRRHDIDDYGHDGDTTIEECRSCDKSFEITLNISYDWSTRCVPGEHTLVKNPRHEGWFDCTVCGEFLREQDNIKKDE